MKIRYQADNDLRRAIVRRSVRREPLIDFRSAQAAWLDRVPDLEVLAFAADAGRVLIRQDLPAGQAVDILLLVWAASEPDEWANRVCLAPSLVTIAIGATG